MKVSVITACYNSRDTIESTLQSVINQSYNNIEYIIVDGASTDGTLEILNKYRNKIAKIESAKDGGVYFALNKGLALATGDIIAFIHADDFYANENVIADVVEVLNKNNTESVYGDLQYVNRINTQDVVRYWKAGKYIHGSFLWGWMPPHPTFFVKKLVYDRLGSFNTGFKSAADYELMLRFLHKRKISTAYLPKVLVKMRVGGQSNITLSNRIKANHEDKQAWEVNGLKPYFFTTLLKPLRKIFQFIRFPKSTI